jgi:hypothetical protein
LFLSVFFLGQEIEIKREDGIPVVYNPKEPVSLPGMPSRVTLIEDLRLGDPDEDLNYPFSMFSIPKVGISLNLLGVWAKCR